MSTPTFYINIYEMISELQAGFREGDRAYAFVLQALTDKQLAKKEQVIRGIRRLPKRV